MPLTATTLRRELARIANEMHSGEFLTYRAAVNEFRRAYLKEVMMRHRGNQSKAAAALGVHRNTLSRSMDELGLTVRECREYLKKPPARVLPHVHQVDQGRLWSA